MTFGFYVALVTLGLLALRWVLFVLYEQKDDSPSFLWFMLDSNAYPQNGRIRLLMTVLVLVAAGFGLFHFD